MKKSVVFAFLVLLPGIVWAQGMSAIRVTAIQTTPASFKLGDNLTFRVTLKNETASPLGGNYGYRVFLTVFAGDVCYRADDPNCHIMWNTNVQQTGAIPPGGTVQVTIPGSYRVTQTADKYCFTSCAIDPPNEFCESHEMCAAATCTYQTPMTFAPVRPELVYQFSGAQAMLKPRSAVPTKQVSKPAVATAAGRRVTRVPGAGALQVIYPVTSQDFQVPGGKLKITVRFNKDVNKATVQARSSFRVQTEKDPNAMGMIQWLNNRELTWTSTKSTGDLCSFNPDCGFTLTIMDTVTSSSGDKLDGNKDGQAGGNFTHNFTIIG